MNRQKLGFTLLEVILSLGLSVMVLAAVGSALNLHLHLLDSGRTRVEEAQLARSIMHIISQDLQSAVPYGSSSSSSTSSGSGGSTTQTGTSTSALSTPPSMFMTAISPSILGQTTGSTTSTGTSSSTSDTGASSTDTTDNMDHTSDIINTGPASQPGIYGNATQIQLDISRLPRTDQYMAILNSGTTNATLASDYRNVAYYVVNSGVGSPLSGLYRREMSRAAGVYASLQGQQLQVTTESMTPIAPEVQEIDFQYTDGTQWLDTWDSSSYGCLPVAVQVTIVITPLNPRNNAVQASIYRMLVSIPAGQPTLTTTTSNSSSTSSSSSSTSSSTTTN